MEHRILFVCTGNTCRSPLAEGLLRGLLREQGLTGIEVRSAGVSAWPGADISRHSAMILQHRGFEGPAHSNSLEWEAMDWATLVLTMTMGHKQQVASKFPEFVHKLYTLKEFVADGAAEHKQAIESFEQLLAEVQMKRALAQPVTDEEWRRLRDLERSLPDYNVEDPFGSSLESYKRCADEIEHELRMLVARWQRSV